MDAQAVVEVLHLNWLIRANVGRGESSHNLDVWFKSADLKTSPEVVMAAAEHVAIGTPEQVARRSGKPYGHYLKPMLAGRKVAAEVRRPDDRNSRAEP